ncbi:ABC transporter ATP-binding protein [Cytophagaceae bacterium DM2B3-1]|uniref:ABC transporter ATP-binding protein n=1 Tax=Xanthocytophaga flava TaxID=3048013 RepID=A0ABT7CH02_9BACT|nr:ABC transporter ATP-binding protein [Xanthocytophaga flavus]MDJ1493020.1 ABC transporter ATP-binding protein [Xanthocytophaga flavus]
MIQTHALNKTFGKLKALDNLSIDLQAGSAISLIGPNGSGKTTFLKCLLGMVIPDSGQILFQNKDIAKDYTYRSQIGYMPQIGRYPDNLTIRQLIEMMKDIRKGMYSQLDEELIHAFALESLFEKQMRTLSGGTRQKVSACLAFLFNPPVLILDEPTAGLDPLAAEILKEKIQHEKRKGKLILITSHIFSDLEELTTDVMYLMDGKVQFYKTLQELKAETREDKLSRILARVMSRESKDGQQLKPFTQSIHQQRVIM